MKKSKIVSSLLIVMLVLLSFSVIAFADEHERSDLDIVEFAVDYDDFTVLAAALDEAGLVETLKGDGPFTVFAPTDAAFGDLLTALGIEDKDLLAHPWLKEVLLYHVASGEALSTQLDGPVETVLGESIPIDDIKLVDELFDIKVKNGVIHVISEVLVPEAFSMDNIVEIAKEDGRFTTLLAALEQEGLDKVLEGSGPFTVFAPTDDAFKDLLDLLEMDSAEELLALEGLDNILKYHVVNGRVLSNDLEDGQMAETLFEGNSIKVTISDGKVMINDAEVIIADIPAVNGVIHVLDAVLIPEEEEEEVDPMGDIGMLPYIFVGALGVSGLVVMKKKK